MSWLSAHWAEIIEMPPIKSKRLPCAVSRCDRPSQALGLCTPHYTAARQRFDPVYRSSYLAAKRERSRKKRRAEGEMAGPEGVSPDTETALP